jgi:hypothetical protein
MSGRVVVWWYWRDGDLAQAVLGFGIDDCALQCGSGVPDNTWADAATQNDRSCGSCSAVRAYEAVSQTDVGCTQRSGAQKSVCCGLP